MSLRTPRSVEKLRKALHAKAKAEPECRFYQLDDKLDRSDVLAHADERSRASGGAPGVDGETFEAIEAKGVERWLGERAQELREKTDRADAVRRVWRAKGQGKRRPLGLPTVRDRVVQTAAVRVVEAIFEADLPDEQYAYRASRSARQAVREVQGLVRRVVDSTPLADVAGGTPALPGTSPERNSQTMSRRAIPKSQRALERVALCTSDTVVSIVRERFLSCTSRYGNAGRSRAATPGGRYAPGRRRPGG